MTPDEFFNEWNNKGLNPDGAYGNQCVDVADQYSLEVVGVAMPLVDGAKDFWTNYPKGSYDRIANTADNFPQKGDIVIWGTLIGKFGHVAIAVSGDANHLTCFGQNWPAQGYLDSDGNYIGTGVCHYQSTNYVGVLGWLRPKASVAPPPPQPSLPAFNDQIRIPLGGEWGDMELGAVRSTLNDQKRDRDAAIAGERDLEKKLLNCQQGADTPQPPETTPISASTLSTATLIQELVSRLLGRR